MVKQGASTSMFSVRVWVLLFSYLLNKFKEIKSKEGNLYKWINIII
jgi:hypothetical protein